MKVTIYSTVDVFYYSFYIEGLYRLYGKRNVKLRLWSFIGTVQRALQNYLKSGDRIFDRKYFFTSYWRQLKRLPLQVYEGSFQVKSNYVYFISSLWQKEMLTNRSRANFIEVCIESEKIIFEGGFAPRSDYKTLGFKSLIDKRITLNNYLRKIKGSFVSFNTPAVQSCFGWKLAEYMVLGKAIISTDVHNVLPAPFEDRKHLHFVSSTKEEIRMALNEILEDHDYRKSLEKHSKEYYHNHLAPEVIVKKLVGYKQEEKNNFD